MSIKQEIEQMAIQAIKCPSCGAERGQYCRKKLTGPRFRDLNATSNTNTHQRRLSQFIAENMHER